MILQDEYKTAKANVYFLSYVFHENFCSSLVLHFLHCPLKFIYFGDLKQVVARQKKKYVPFLWQKLGRVILTLVSLAL